MYLNTILLRFGLDPNNFVNELVEPFISDDGKTIINLRQKPDKKICPECGCVEANINNYYWTETNFTTNEGEPLIIRIKKVRFKCKGCGKTYTPEILGIERYARISKSVEELIIKDFYKQMPFAIIAQNYNLSVTEVIKIFDSNFPYIKRGTLPTALCIDEIGFKTDVGKYAAILYDHDQKKVVDIIESRQTNFLRDYFSFIPFKERENVKYFISDLYEGYTTIKNEFFPNAIHIADLFHVIRLLKVEVSKLRIKTYKQYTYEGDIERHFMKQNWSYFEQYLSSNLAHKPYFSKKENFEYTVWHMMERCLKLNMEFWDAYACLQDFYEYWRCKTFDQGMLWLDKIIKQLSKTGNEDLIRVANTFKKWKPEIANAITIRNLEGKRYSNGPAEGLNNSIKTIIKDANGFKNFKRFRIRALLILRERKDLSSVR